MCELKTYHNEKNPNTETYNQLSEALIPGSGHCETLEGEMLRAANKIGYRFYNDGDFFYKGYGCETAGPAMSFLVNCDALPPELTTKFKAFENTAATTETEKAYEKFINDLLDIIVLHIVSLDGEYTPNTDKIDMLDFDSEYEEENEEDQCWECGNDESACECEEPCYVCGENEDYCRCDETCDECGELDDECQCE